MGDITLPCCIGYDKKAKRRGKLARGVLLLQDNAPVHTVAIAKGAISQKLTIILIIPIRLYVTIFYFQLSKKKKLRGRKFKTDDEFQSAVLEHFKGKPPEYFLNGLQLLLIFAKSVLQSTEIILKNSRFFFVLLYRHPCQANSLWDCLRI
jgi:hypothetical protein